MFYIFLKSFSLFWDRPRIYRIILSNSNEEGSSGEKENVVLVNAYPNTGFSDSELAYPLD